MANACYHAVAVAVAPQTLPWEMLASRDTDRLWKSRIRTEIRSSHRSGKLVRFCLRQRDLLTNNVWTINEFPRRANKARAEHRSGSARAEHKGESITCQACQTVIIVHLSASVARRCEPMKVNGTAVSLPLFRLARSAAEAIRHHIDSTQIN